MYKYALLHNSAGWRYGWFNGWIAFGMLSWRAALYISEPLGVLSNKTIENRKEHRRMHHLEAIIRQFFLSFFHPSSYSSHDQYHSSRHGSQIHTVGFFNASSLRLCEEYSHPTRLEESDGTIEKLKLVKNSVDEIWPAELWLHPLSNSCSKGFGEKRGVPGIHVTLKWRTLMTWILFEVTLRMGVLKHSKGSQDRR